MKKQKENDIICPSSHFCMFCLSTLGPLLLGVSHFLKQLVYVARADSQSVSIRHRWNDVILPPGHPVQHSLLQLCTFQPNAILWYLFQRGVGSTHSFWLFGSPKHNFSLQFHSSETQQVQPPPLYNFRREREGTIEVFICSMCLPGYVLLSRGMFHWSWWGISSVYMSHSRTKVMTRPML